MTLKNRENFLKIDKYKKYLLITAILLRILLLIENYYIENFIDRVLSINGDKVKMIFGFIVIIAINILISFFVYKKIN